MKIAPVKNAVRSQYVSSVKMLVLASLAIIILSPAYAFAAFPDGWTRNAELIIQSGPIVTNREDFDR